MSDLRKAAEMALEWIEALAFELADAQKKPKIIGYVEVIKALRQALAQPEQEPALGLTAQKNGVVARLYLNPTSPLGGPDLRVELPYSEIPACNREWVGLTTREIIKLANMYHAGKLGTVASAFNAVEAKLKEKNGG